MLRFNDTRTNTGCLDVKMISMLRYTPCDAENPNPGAPHAALRTYAAN